MIASLRGTVVSVELNGAVIECAGVGYFFTATPQTLATLRRGEEAQVLTTMVLRDDAVSLYGFSAAEQRAMFSLLQTVSGLGPRLALASLAVLDPEEIARAVRGKDLKTLQTIPGVGKRMAERMSLELAEKVAGFASAEPEEQGAAAVPDSPAAGQVTAALVGLGFTEKQAGEAVAAVFASDADLDTSAALRAALRRLGKK
ncbi:ATP-dependent DNA helicase RuvA [Corynebacterium atypicum]|uniref:Holliday junction branch migration complex subunit RuvA n=1 Tax=Corynebacterium atypicum TaxID=191610 RepID=A0ABM5QMK1_9CORY|nr:Holliday junction branch migration protein RuvA [Corynebacterium atypicum]AIG64046.1 ATP-dependent DNA helicase RuvA [Corynebacterium atypicum]